MGAVQTTRGGNARSVVVAVLAVAVAFAVGDVGCFNPKVTPGGLLCATSGKACPDGFECVAGHCELPGGGTGGAGGAPCANPTPSPCSPTKASPDTQPCDYVCQRNGCGCGLRCGSNAAVACLAPAGSKQEGDTCSLANDDCAPGFVCHRERCGNNLGRCYRLCTDGSHCPATVCGTVISLGDGTEVRGCNQGEHTCNAMTGQGCPDMALICYATSRGHTTCDCPTGGTKVEGDTCQDYTECTPGLICIGESGQPSSRCHKLCVTTADCPSCDGFLCPLP